MGGDECVLDFTLARQRAPPANPCKPAAPCHCRSSLGEVCVLDFIAASQHHRPSARAKLSNPLPSPPGGTQLMSSCWTSLWQVNTTACHPDLLRRRNPGDEFVLDFIVERKSVQDLASSIMDKSGRYERQKVGGCGVVLTAAPAWVCSSMLQLRGPSGASATRRTPGLKTNRLAREQLLLPLMPACRIGLLAQPQSCMPSGPLALCFTVLPAPLRRALRVLPGGGRPRPATQGWVGWDGWMGGWLAW